MQITVNSDFNNGPNGFTQAQINSFLADEQTAINILDAALRTTSRSCTTSDLDRSKAK